MQKYQYQHGDRPLEGFTIERAAGRGGFGEVYYAVSDSGREVAIKAVQNYEQIELRGISQCMNLKSPHLVTIFDVKRNDRNEPFVIMEYVSGPSLRDLLTESPHGLGVQKAAFFLREIAKSLSFLHECGVVHRDLKPSNIFYENGYVKVGDYGLAKAISASRHSGHTITVGTVHYMAPEIGAGSYNRSIDIYALGVLLYEMLTGEVPFVGSSPAEILMKHMTVTPDLNNIEEPFASVIRKALAKDPADRYETVQEMVEDLFGSENIRNSVSHFSPDELSVVAQRVAAKANIGEQHIGGKHNANSTTQTHVNVGQQITETAQRFARQVDALGRKVADRVDAETSKLLGSKVHVPGVADPVHPGQRRTLALLTMIIVALGTGVLSGNIVPTSIVVFVMTGVCAKTILFSSRRWFVNLEQESRWVGKLATCCLASFLATLIGIMLTQHLGTTIIRTGSTLLRPGIMFPFRKFFFFGPARGAIHSFGGTWLSLAVPMLLVDWYRISSPQRPKRLSLGSALWLGLLGLIAAQIFGSAPLVIAAVLAGTSLVVQAASLYGRAAQHMPAAQTQPKKAQQQKKETPSRNSTAYSMVPRYVRVFWLVGSFVMLSFGLSLLLRAGMDLSGDDFARGVALGVDSLILSLFCFVGTFHRRFTGWYPYLIKPLILLACILTVVASSICMGNMRLDSDKEFLAALYLIIFPAIVFFVVAIIPARLFKKTNIKPAALTPPVAKPHAGISSFKRLWALLLSAGGLFGFCGLHRFYVGKILTGILWFLTWGIFGIGQIIDVIMILVGQFKDRYGLPLVIWQDNVEFNAKTPNAKPAGQWHGLPARENTAKMAVPPGASPAQPPPTAPTTTVVYEPFHPFAFLFSGIGFILTFLAIVVGLAVGLHFPHFVAAGWPDPKLAAELERFFGYPAWPELVMRLGTIIVVILLLLAAVCIIIGRRHLGAGYLIRGALGLTGFFFVLLVFSDSMSGYYFQEVVNMLNSQQIGPAFEKLLRSTHNEEALFAGVLFLVSVVVLAWPPRRRETIIKQPINQGVS